MANLISTNLKTAQAKLTGKFASNEMRLISANTYKSIITNTSIMVPNYEELRKNESRTLEASLLTRTKRTVSTGRSASHTGTRGDSAVFTPQWTTSAISFSDSLKMYGNNTVARQEALNNSFENAYLDVIESLEGEAQDFIYGERSGVNVSTGGGGTFDETDDVYNFANANIDTVIQKTKTVMEENGYKGRITIYADSIAYDLFEYQAFQGSGNGTNLSFQKDNVEFVRSIDLASKFAPLAGTYTTGVWIAAPEASVGALPWVPAENRAGISTRLQTYATGISPYDGVSYATHFYEVAEDNEASNGELQDETVQYEVSIDMSFFASPITVTDETALFAFSLQA
tara:strand:- start:602 stop:1630 length:1029 start_codon:yes stop_codon:yes gene_type:complete